MRDAKIHCFLNNNHVKKKLKPATVMELKGVFEKCHNYIYANEGLLKEKVFNEILKLIFIKTADEKNDSPYCQFYVSENELKKLKEGKHTAFKERISKLFDGVKIQYSGVFKDQHEKINLKALTLGFVVNQLQRYSFIKTPTDVKGTAFQTFVYAHQRGSRGEFFTPTPIIELAVRILDPRNDETIIDPACGSGGFLVEPMEWVRKKFIKYEPKLRNETDEYVEDYAYRYICGIDINPDLVRVVKMRMILYGDGRTGIFTANSLLPFDELVSIAEKSGVPPSLRPYPESFDVLMTNPPFGTKGKITDKKILQNFDLGHKWVKRGEEWRKTDKLLAGEAPEVLFIERCLQLLKDGGRMAIVLPDGIVENPSQGYIRQFVKSNAKILGVIKLPPETFIPYGTGINASILFLQRLAPEKLEEEIDRNYDVFFAIIKKIGYEGTKNGKATYKRNEKGQIIKDDKGNPILDEDITEVIEAYVDLRKGKSMPKSNKLFLRKYNEIEDRLNAKFYQPKYKELREELMKVGAVPLGKVVEIVSKKAEILQNPEAVIRYVELGDVDPLSSELVSYTRMKVYEAPSRAHYEIKEGNVITAVSGNSTGTEKHASAHVTKEFDGCICTNGFRVLRSKKVAPLYLLYFLRTKAFLMQMYQLRTGAAIPTVSNNDLKRVLIVSPEKNIQEKISQRMKESYQLRKKSIEMIEELHEIMDKIMSKSSQKFSPTS